MPPCEAAAVPCLGRRLRSMLRMPSKKRTKEAVGCHDAFFFAADTFGGRGPQQFLSASLPLPRSLPGKPAPICTDLPQLAAPDKLCDFCKYQLGSPSVVPRFCVTFRPVTAQYGVWHSAGLYSGKQARLNGQHPSSHKHLWNCLDGIQQRGPRANEGTSRGEQ
ncbi:hypothetical protein DL89DRAFT_162606 [Linderina pennispora]|uniref:Uncharacterized protein n=1 Tax=Linderina pennispora TaxID=61395 RepID=A0A1Y1W7P8_9FUNG|nr:uncharacterized protein DL89DRAFT_162606 [Linderina pennispora]ORX69537.1 hypothetical protein DL89DRAFT_162606 [Linderina pennispora]